MRSPYHAEYEVEIPGALLEFLIHDAGLRLCWHSGGTASERFYVASCEASRDDVSTNGDGVSLQVGGLRLTLPPRRLRVLADALASHGFHGCRHAGQGGA